MAPLPGDVLIRLNQPWGNFLLLAAPFEAQLWDRMDCGAATITASLCRASHVGARWKNCPGIVASAALYGKPEWDFEERRAAAPYGRIWRKGAPRGQSMFWKLRCQGGGYCSLQRDEDKDGF